MRLSFPQLPSIPRTFGTTPAATLSLNVGFVEYGSSDAPFVIEEAGAQNTTVAADSYGVYYTYVAPEAGTVNVIMYSESWVYVVNNLTAYVYGDTQYSDMDPAVPCTEMAVSAGDELMIMVNTYDPANPWNAPAGSVSWELEFVPGAGEEPEEAELGSYENPYIINAGDTRVAAYIEAGATVYVKATDANNSTFTLGYATAATYEIWYLRAQYLPNTESGNNDTSFTMVSDVDTFGITNTGDEAITVYMALTAGEVVEDETGTMDNPEVLTFATNMWGGVGASASYEFAANNSGRYYKVVAPADGQIVFDMQGAVDADWNNLGWFYFVQNLTAGIYGDNHWSDDEVVAYNEAWDVSAGDELLIFVSTYDPANMWNNPAGTVSFQLAFNSFGSYDLPYDVEAGDQTTTVAEGSQGVYYTYTATENGTVTVTMNSDAWTYVVNNVTAGTYGDTQWSDSDPVVASTTVTVEAGDIIQIMVNTYDPANEWTAPAGDVEWTLTFAAEVVKDYKITFDPDGGVMPEGVALEYGINYQENYKEATGIEYPVPTLEGYTFGGWYWELYNYTLTQGDWDGGYFAVQMDVPLVALWVEA